MKITTLLRALALAGLCALTAPAMAGYANLRAPEGWGGSASSGYTWNRTSANSPWSGGSAAAQVTAQVEGRAVTMSASMRLAANAGRYVATAARFTPGGIVTAAVASWLLSEGISYIGDNWAIGEPGLIPGVSTIDGYWTGNDERTAAPTPAAMCKLAGDIFAGNFVAAGYVFQPRPDGLPQCVGIRAGDPSYANPSFPIISHTYTYQGPAPGSVPTEVDWGKFDTKPVPDQVANDTPGPLPVGLPSLNPDPTGLPQPVTVPTGDPVPVPETVPQQYKQPVTDIVPSPTQNEPWRVDQRPREVIGTDPTGVPEPTGTSTQPGTAQEIDIETCGLPGKPKCLIDEQDTPTPTTSNPAPAPTPATDVATATEDIREIVENPGVLGPFPDIVWSFELPSFCGPIETPAFAPFLNEIDVCRFQPLFHDIMSMVWILGALFGSIGLFWRDQFGSA